MYRLESKLCYRFELKTDSPLSIGGSYTENTDHDIICYADGTPFIPASSISGCFFTKDEKYHRMFGIAFLGDKENPSEGVSSPLFVSDGLFEKEVKLSKRDGNSLQGTDLLYKQAVETAKFDNEIIMNNQLWSFYITIDVFNEKQQFSENDYDECIKEIASHIDNGDYRIGYKQNRGYGKQKIIRVIKKKYDKTNYREYLDFNGYKFYGDIVKFSKNNNEEISLSMPVKAISPICIKNYSAIKNMPDYSQIRALDSELNENLAAIPGTTLNGVIQSDVNALIYEKNLEKFIDREVFKKYVIDEMYLKGEFLKQSRNRIDRFSSGTVDGALYTEEIFTPTEESIGVINIRFKHKNLLIIALFYLALCDIKEGYASIGGNEGIGRGIFTSNEEIKISGTSKLELSNALKEVL